jgi:hypothetical protein
MVKKIDFLQNYLLPTTSACRKQARVAGLKPVHARVAPCLRQPEAFFCFINETEKGTGKARKSKQVAKIPCLIENIQLIL